MIDCTHAVSLPLHDGLLLRCLACGLVTTARVPTYGYDATYFTGNQGGGYDFESEVSAAIDAERFRLELDGLAAQGLSGSLLDIGCATGSYLAAARARGWQVAGVEVAEYARQLASTRAGVPVAASLDELPSGSQYDVVTLHHVLEHITNPGVFLRDQVRPRAKGRLLIEVPNFSSLGSRIDGAAWQDLRPEQHVTHFTAATLEALVEDAGFTVTRTASLWAPLWSGRATLDLARLLIRAALKRAPEPPLVRPSLPPASSAAVLPRGWRRGLVALAHAGCRPVVRLLERRRLGARLVVEAAARQARR